MLRHMRRWMMLLHPFPTPIPGREATVDLLPPRPVNIALPIVGPEALDGIGALCSRSMAKAPTPTELGRCLFAPDRPSLVRYAPDVGVVAVGRSDEGGFIRLLLLDPSCRGQGLGHELLLAAESDLRGHRLSPPAPMRRTFCSPVCPSRRRLCVAFSNVITTAAKRQTTTLTSVFWTSRLILDLPWYRRGPTVPRLILGWAGTGRTGGMRSCGPSTRARSCSGGTTGTYRGFCAYDVNTSGTLGPIASRPDLIGQGVGAPLLVGALHRLPRSRS